MKIKGFICIICALSLVFLSGCEATEDNNLKGDVYIDGGTSTAFKAEYNESGISSDKSFDDLSDTEAVSSVDEISSGGNAAIKNLSVRTADKKYYKLAGRSYMLGDGGINLPWGCSDVEFKISCEGDVTLSFDSEKENYIGIYLNGRLCKNRQKIMGKGVKISLKTNQKGVNTLRVVRQTGFESGNLILRSFSGKGLKLIREKAEYSSRYIEFLGDAALAGRGVLLEDSYFENFNSEEVAKPIHQNTTLCYPFLVGERLSADISVVAMQGAGIGVSYFTGATEGRLSVLKDYASLAAGKKYKTDKKPDYIVIDAGSADFNLPLIKAKGLTEADSVENVINFFTALRKDNPKAKIIWCYGLTGKPKSFVSYLKEIMLILGGEENGFYILELPETKRLKAYPSAADHNRSAELLIKRIEEIENG